MSNPWIENDTGLDIGEYPVAGDVPIDVMHRSGQVYENQLVGLRYAEDFSIDGVFNDILRWRLHDGE